MSNPADWRKEIEEIKKIVIKRADQYQGLLVRSIVFQQGGSWRNLITRIDAISKQEILPKDEILDFGDIVAMKRVLQVDELEGILAGLDLDKVRIRDFPEYYLKIGNVNVLNEKYVSSYDRFFNSQWPSDCYHFEPPSDDRIRYASRHALVKPDSVLFPTSDELVKYWCSLNTDRYIQFYNSLIVILPYFLLRITELRIGIKSIKLSLDFNKIELNDVIGKVYLDNDLGEMEQFDFEVSGREVLLDTHFEPDKVFVHILSKSSGEVLDYRRIYLSWNELPEGVTFGSDDFAEMIENGEGQTVEFKREIGKSLTSIIETIIAFSNSYGGVIFLGVDKDAEIYGIDPKNVADTIMNSLADCCEPPIIPEITSVKIEGKDVVVIEVEEGNDKPYNYRNRGVFVRRNGTTRRASRFELDRLGHRSSIPSM